MEGYIDLRKLDRGETLRLRRQVVSLRLKGCCGAEIEAAVGVRQNRISEIWRLYLKEGYAGLAPGAPGRKPGEKTLLPASAEREIRRLLIENTPDLLGMPYSLWTRHIASDFIRRDFGVRLPLRSITNYFKRWGFVCGIPVRAAAKNRGAEFSRFMEEEFAAVVRRAASENVGIYWYSETWVRREYPQGGAPGADGVEHADTASGADIQKQQGGASGTGGASGARRTPGVSGMERVMMAQVATARGTARFMFFEGRMTQKKFTTLSGRLIRYADRKVFLIAEDRKPYKGKKVEAWLKGREDRIEIIYYPSLQANSGR